MAILNTTIDTIPYSDGDDPIATGDDLIEQIVKKLDGYHHTPGDLKVGLQAADHGLWLFADARNTILRADVSPAFVALMLALGYAGTDAAHIGVPDYRGRTLVGLGQHADVNALTDNDGLPVAKRTPKHNSTVNDPGHLHHESADTLGDSTGPGGHQGYSAFDSTEYAPGQAQPIHKNGQPATSTDATGIRIGPDNANPALQNRPIDTVAYGVGNIFIFAGKP